MGSGTGRVPEGGVSPPFLRRVMVAAVIGSVVGAAVFATVSTTAHGPAATAPGSGTPPGVTHATTTSVTTRLAALPLAFARGTTPAPSYVAGAPGTDVQVTSDQVDLTMVRGSGSGPRAVGTASSAPTHATSSRIGLDLVGADPTAPLSTQGALPGHVNMFVGPRQSWRSDLPTYQAVVAHDAWPGVDVRYGGRSGSLEYTLTVAPGTNPSVARLRLTGVTGLHVDSRGDLVGRSAAGTVSEQALRAWQVIGGRRRAVPAAYRLQGTTVSFQVGSYDRSRPLVIDPTVVTGYATYLSGSPLSEVLGLATDQAGNTYAVGFTGGTGFPTTGSPAYGGGLTDAFVTELNPAGTSALFSTYLGGVGEDVATAVALGPSGSIYVAGYTDSPDFPIVGGTRNTNDNNTIFGAENDGFLTVLATGGGSIKASTLIGGSGEDEIEALAVDAAGNAHIAGLTTWDDFPGLGGTAGTLQDFDEAERYVNGGYSNPNSDAFVATVDDTSGQLVLGPVTSLGVGQGAQVDALTLDSAGNAFVAGGDSNPLATVGGAYSGEASYTEHDGGFVAEVSPAGSVTWLAWMGSNMQLYGIALDAAGNVDVVGAAYPGLATTAGVVDPTDPGGGPQAMAASLSPNGATLRWATYLGGTNGTSEADAVAVAPDGSLLVTGGTASTSGVATAGAPQAAYGGGASDAFLVDLAADATAVDWGTYLGGPGADWAMTMSLVPGGVAIGGLATPPSFPVSAGSLQTTPAAAGTQAGFVADVLVVPTVTAVSPAFGSVAGGTTVTVTGTGFTGATAVHVGATAASFTVVSDSQLTVITPSGTPGTVHVTVTGPGGTSAATTADLFDYQATQAALTITSTAVTYGHALTLATSGGTTGGAVTYQVTSAGTAGCAVSGASLTATSAGTCTVTATMAGDTDYQAVSSAPTVITVSDGSYLLVAPDGGVFAFGGARFAGSCPATGSVCAGVSDIVGAAATPDGKGYWLVGADGSVYPFGAAVSYGSMRGTHLREPVVGIAATPDGKGYWLVASDGGVFAFGDATFAGSMGGTHLREPVVGMAATPDGKGYWLVAADGGVFAFGSARFTGSCPVPGSVCAGVTDIVGAAATPDGKGYWLVGADGSVYPFGTAVSYGSMRGTHLNKPVVGMAATIDGKGYWLAGADGGVFAFGDATFAGSMGGIRLDAPVVGLATPAVRPPG